MWIPFSQKVWKTDDSVNHASVPLGMSIWNRKHLPTWWHPGVEGLIFLLGPWVAWSVNMTFLVPSFGSHHFIRSGHSPSLWRAISRNVLFQEGLWLHLCQQFGWEILQSGNPEWSLSANVSAHRHLWLAKGHEWTHEIWASRAAGRCKYFDEDLPDRTPERLSEDMPERKSENLPDDVLERLLQKMPERMWERISEELPERLSEDMLWQEECQKTC